MFQQILDLSLSSLLLLLTGFYGTILAIQFILDPLRDIPGPLLARFTRFWLFFEIYKGSFERTNIELHRKYGPIVRVAPGEYSIDDFEAARTIYGYSNAFVKVRMSQICIVGERSRLISMAGAVVSGVYAPKSQVGFALHRPGSTQTCNPATEILCLVFNELPRGI